MGEFIVFEKTDIARQLREANVPESAYMYVESLWLRNIEAKEIFDKILRRAVYARDEIEDVIGFTRERGTLV